GLPRGQSAGIELAHGHGHEKRAWPEPEARSATAQGTVVGLNAKVTELEPLPVISLEYAPPDAARRFCVALPVCEASGLAACAIAFGLLFAEVQLVLVSGPLIFVIGAAMVGMGVHRRDWAR